MRKSKSSSTTNIFTENPAFPPLIRAATAIYYYFIVIYGKFKIYCPLCRHYSAKVKKEDITRRIIEEDGLEDGLVCALKTLEACKIAKVYSMGENKLTVKSLNTKCLHYYLYYQDKVFGFMLVKIQTWFPFNIQVYLHSMMPV